MAKDSTLVQYRSKTILLLVQQEEDVAPIAAMCALMGDLYRRRTFFDKQPMVIIRVAVVPSLKHYFARDGQIVTWRAHESCSRSARWITHVGAPDSIWTLDGRSEGGKDENYDDIDCSGAFIEAYRGLSNSNSFISHDDGGMADMILVGSSSSLSLPLWRQLALLVASLRKSENYRAGAPPLVIASLGNLRGQDWLSRRAFADTKKSRGTPLEWQRHLSLVGFPENLWNCRLVPTSQSQSPKKVKTTLTMENSIVLMLGRNSAAVTKQNVSIISNVPSRRHPEQVLQLLRHTIFPPKTELQVVLPPPAIERPNNASLSYNNSHAKPYIYNLLWLLVQDPHMIQFPCYSAIHHPKTSSNSKQQQLYQTTSRPSNTLGALILSVFEEVLVVVHEVQKEIFASSTNNDQAKHDEMDEIFYKCITHPLEKSLLTKLLGTGGVLVEDMSNNRMAELLIRLRSSSKDTTFDGNLVKQRWILEPLLTRAALSEWHFITHQSPYPSDIHSSESPDTVLARQLQRECVEYGLGLVFQLSQLLNMQPNKLSTIRWVLQHTPTTTATTTEAAADSHSVVRLSSWNVNSMSDLQQFLALHDPLGDISATETSRLFSKLWFSIMLHWSSSALNNTN